MDVPPADQSDKVEAHAEHPEICLLRSERGKSSKQRHYYPEQIKEQSKIDL